MHPTAEDRGAQRRLRSMLRWDGMPEEVARGLTGRLDALVEQGRILKGGTDDRGVVVRLDPQWEGGPPLVLKRYHGRGAAHALVHAAIPTHASRSWSMARRLVAAGLRTPRVLAMGETRLGPLRGPSWFVAEWVEARSLGQVLDDPDLPPSRRARLAEEMRLVFAVLASRRLRHRDVKLANFLVLEPSDELVLIDLDGMRGPIPAPFFAAVSSRDVRRFLANFPEDAPDRRLFADAIAGPPDGRD